MTENRVEASGCLGMALFLFVITGSALGWLWLILRWLGE